MTQSLVSVILFLLLLAMAPLAIRWTTQRRMRALGVEPVSTKLISVLGLGTQQRVVTVEVGPPGARSWLVLGVTPQSIRLLHSCPSPGAPLQVTPQAAPHD